jgi:hypothetical protein
MGKNKQMMSSHLADDKLIELIKTSQEKKKEWLTVDKLINLLKEASPDALVQVEGCDDVEYAVGIEFGQERGSSVLIRRI